MLCKLVIENGILVVTNNYTEVEVERIPSTKAGGLTSASELKDLESGFKLVKEINYEEM